METINDTAEINGDALIKLLKNDNSSHKGLIINLDKPLVINLNEVSLRNNFEECTFKGYDIDIEDRNWNGNKSDSKARLTFNKCIFQLDKLTVYHCFFDYLIFRNTTHSPNEILIKYSSINNFIINKSKNTKLTLEANGTVFNHSMNIDEVLISQLYINECAVKQNSIIKDCNVTKLIISNSKFLSDSIFKNNHFSASDFNHNDFEKTDFSHTDFREEASFYNNTFKGATQFRELKSPQKTNFKIRSCNFLKYAYFNNSNLEHLSIDTSTFNDIASFQDTKIGHIEIDRTLFEKAAFFDNMEVTNITQCNKRTIRIIKQQLLRTDNKIDYDIYKAHELNAHKIHLKESLGWRYLLDKDAIILIVSFHFSNNGVNWLKALILTFLWGGFFYSLFYLGYMFNFNISKIYTIEIDEFCFGFTKYIIPTNIYNPLAPGKTFVDKTWLPFIFGKIVVTIGIYETIKSFRKFKK